MLVTKFKNGFSCKKCNLANCDICSTDGSKCSFCYDGFSLEKSGACQACPLAQLWDPLTRTCFPMKPNNFIDISYNHAYNDIIVSDIFGISQDTRAVMNFDLDYVKIGEDDKKLKPPQAMFNVTVSDGTNSTSTIFSNEPRLTRRKFY